MRLVFLLGLLLAPLALTGCAVQQLPPQSGLYSWQQAYQPGVSMRWHDDVCVEC
jgi:hypothetical protein